MDCFPLSIYEVEFLEKRALIRVDFNVPLDQDCCVIDNYRIRMSITTIKKILARGGSCIIMSHLGRPQGKHDAKYSMRHLIPSIEDLLGLKVQFADDCIGQETEDRAKALRPGEVLLLENLRFYPAEEKCGIMFARQLAKLGDVYVNDAFGTIHRKHASVTRLPELFMDKCIGIAMQRELEQANRILEEIQNPFVVIVGGAKVSDKIAMIDKMLETADKILIGGGMAHTFWRAQGGSVGSSLVEEKKVGLAKKLLKKAREMEVDILLPVDAVMANKMDTNAHTEVVESNNIKENWMGLDIGPKTQELFTKTILAAKTILWNGPMGVFEINKFARGTQAIGEAVAEATQKGAFSLVGGGDSAAAVKQFELENRISHLSTGGGALLAYLEDRPLPAMDVLKPWAQIKDTD